MPKAIIFTQVFDNPVVTGIGTVIIGIIAVAVLAVLVSQRSNTANVITTIGNVFSGALRTATCPISGSC